MREARIARWLSDPLFLNYKDNGIKLIIFLLLDSSILRKDPSWNNVQLQKKNDEFLKVKHLR